MVNHILQGLRPKPNDMGAILKYLELENWNKRLGTYIQLNDSPHKVPTKLSSAKMSYF